MPFDLNVFRNKLVHGGARPNQFEMRVNWPQIIPQGVSAAADFPFLCTVAELPASNIGNIPVGYFGRKLRFAGDRDFGDGLTVTVINDEDFKVRIALEAWMRAITEHSTTISRFDGGLTSGGYATDGEVRQYSRNNNGNGGVPLRAYRFIGMFPTNVAAIPVSWEQENTIETYAVTFQYQWWDVVDANTGAASV